MQPICATGVCLRNINLQQKEQIPLEMRCLQYSKYNIPAPLWQILGQSQHKIWYLKKKLCVEEERLL